MAHKESEDDMTLSLHIQQFLDEWFFRVLHANLSGSWDRETTIRKALELFEAGGATVLPEEKRLELTRLEYEDELTEGIVKIIPASMRRNMEHFLLQVQLVLSTATRVRMTLEGGTPQDVAKAMEDGDAGITQQILKQVVTRAVKQVAMNQDSHASWEHQMDVRSVRLARCADEAEKAMKELDEINKQIGVFGSEQNNKAKKMLIGLCDGQNKMLLKTVMGSWVACYAAWKRDRDVHMKWRASLDAAEKKLIDYKLYQKGNVHGVMSRKNMASKSDLLREVISVWVSSIQQEKEDRELGGRIAATQQRLDNMKSTQKENAKSAMIKVCAGNAVTLINMCYDAWAKDVREERKNKDFNDAVRASEAQLKSYMKQKKDQAQGVLNKMTGSSGTGLIYQVFTAWSTEYFSVKKGREMESMLESQKSRFTTLNSRQKGAGYNTQIKVNQLDDQVTLQHIFMNWIVLAKCSYLDRNYGERIDKKKAQLEKVQTMFQSFARELDQGIQGTPRSQRKTQQSSKPPHLPAA